MCFSLELRGVLKLRRNEAVPNTDQEIYDAVLNCPTLGSGVLPQSAKGTRWKLAIPGYPDER
jgi:hypothetical protein